MTAYKHSQDGTAFPLNAELNPICHLLALLGAHHILHVSRIGVKLKRDAEIYSQVLASTYQITRLNLKKGKAVP
jgi:hypothetical protein